VSRGDLTGAYLQGADLQGADLQGADLRAAHLQKAQLRGAQANADTKWPDGFDWRAAGVVMEPNE
jgi:uncharacterized protein YjbI with pentapeptide repeats